MSQVARFSCNRILQRLPSPYKALSGEGLLKRRPSSSCKIRQSLCQLWMATLKRLPLYRWVTLWLAMGITAERARQRGRSWKSIFHRLTVLCCTRHLRQHHLLPTRLAFSPPQFRPNIQIGPWFFALMELGINLTRITPILSSWSRC